MRRLCEGGDVPYGGGGALRPPDVRALAPSPPVGRRLAQPRFRGGRESPVGKAWHSEGGEDGLDVVRVRRHRQFLVGKDAPRRGASGQGA